ncbi:hypothetical protein PM082_017289 [Marasmius tenuissimus]|nr:hypothetical protein PM082_017289 [Marasmius tenuissimus]
MENMSPHTAKHTAHIADSISSLNKTVLSAFSDMEAKYQESLAKLGSETTQARNETRDARAERDNAVKRLHEAHLESLEWKHEIASLKASLKQSENTISQQADNVVQLRKDLSSWKDQARNWQEHFLRVEEARCALSTKLEEYKEMLNNRPILNAAPLTPVSRYADSDGAGITKEKHNDYPCSSPDPPGPSQPPRSLPQRKKTPMPKVKAVKHDAKSDDRVVIKQRKSNPVDPTTQTQMQRTEPPTIVQSRLIRRVQAVVHMKEEADSEDERLDNSPTSSPPPIQHPVMRSKSWKNAQKYMSQALEEDELNDEVHADGHPEDGREEEEEEDDELMMTSQTRIDDEPYTPPISKHAAETPPPSKKRRRNNSHIRPSTKRKI